MVNPDIQTKLDRLEKLEQAGRDRSRRYLEKIKREGKKQFSAVINLEAYNELNRRRDASILAGMPLSYGGVIETALLQNLKQNIDIIPTVNKNIKPHVNDIVNIDDKKTLINTDAKQDLNQILLNLKSGTWAEKAHRLNDKSILTAKGRSWSESNIRMAVKALKKKEQTDK